MRSRIFTGAVAGLAASVAFGLRMQMMTAPTPDGRRMPMMAMVAMVVRSQSLVVGWLYHLFTSAVIGAHFGAFLGTRALGRGLRATLAGERCVCTRCIAGSPSPAARGSADVVTPGGW